MYNYDSVANIRVGCYVGNILPVENPVDILRKNLKQSYIEFSVDIDNRIYSYYIDLFDIEDKT